MEKLAYDEDDAIRYYSKSDPEISKEGQLFLEILRQELKIEFNPLSKNRLDQLHDKYFCKLEINEFTEFDYDLLKPEHRKIIKDFFDQADYKKGTPHN